MARHLSDQFSAPYIEQGQGEPLVLISGYSMTKEGWGPVFDDLAEDFRVIAFDNRGVGGFEPTGATFSIADMVADTIRLMDELNIEKAHIMGISMGGLIAQTLCIEYPERVIKAVLGCTTHGGREAVPGGKTAMQALASSADPSQPRDDVIQALLPYFFHDRSISSPTDGVAVFLETYLNNIPRDGLQGQLGAFSVFNSKPRLAEIICPVLVITGTEDVVIPSENSERLATAIQGAELINIENTGHLFLLEKPQQVVSEVVKFLKT